MDKWDFDIDWFFEDDKELLVYLTEELADRFFLSDNSYTPRAGENYDLGHLEPEDWWPLVNQLDETVDLEEVMDILDELEELLHLPGLPTGLLEAPLDFLEKALEGELPPERSGRQVGSRKLVKIAQAVIRLARELPETAQAAIRAWASVHRNMMHPGYKKLTDLLFSSNLPPAINGFSMMVALTLMRWPERAAGLPVPADFSDPALYQEVLTRWQALPDSPAVTVEGEGEAEALFAQAQLAHLLAQAGSMGDLSSDEMDEEEMTMAYSRLSRAILWVHNQCRRCPERQEIACRVADNWPERPVPLVDVATEIANTSQIGGCIRMGR